MTIPDNTIIVGTGNGNDTEAVAGSGENTILYEGGTGEKTFGNPPVESIDGLREELNIQAESLSTMFVNGYGMTVNADPTKVDIASGEGVHVDYWTTPGIPPAITRVTYAGATAISITDIGLGPATWLSVNSDNTITQRNAATGMQTPEQMRDVIALFLVIHTAGTVGSIAPAHTIGLSLGSTVRDMIDYTGLISKGFIIGPATSTTKIKKGEGSYFFPMSNWGASPTISEMKSPNTKAIAEADNLTYVLNYRVSGGGYAYLPASDIVFNRYDDGTGTAVVPPSSNVPTNSWTANPVFLASDGTTVVFTLDQNTHLTLEGAIASIGIDEWDVDPSIRRDTLRGFVILRGGGSDTGNIGVDVSYKQMNRFGTSVNII